MPGGETNKTIIDLDIIGAGNYLNDVCPVCLSSYRTRSVVEFFQKNNIIFNKMRILHIAPEIGLYHYIIKQEPLKYICGDINPQRYSGLTNIIYINLLSIPFPEETFDLVICNHVLEHIPNDTKAMKEIYRILAKGRKAILQAPFSNILRHTIEDPKKSC